MRGGIGDPRWESLHTVRDAQGDSGTRPFSFFMPPDAAQARRRTDAGRESVFVSSYFRNNLAAILIICLLAAAIGVAAGFHFAAEPYGQAAASGTRPADTHLRQSQMNESPASPSETIMRRIEEMRKIAAEDDVDAASSVAHPVPAAERAERGTDARQAQPAAGSHPGRPCTAASMALALCDHR